MKITEDYKVVYHSISDLSTGVKLVHSFTHPPQQNKWKTTTTIYVLGHGF